MNWMNNIQLINKELRILIKIKTKSYKMLGKFCALSTLSAVAAVKQKAKCPFGYTSSSSSLVETSEESALSIKSGPLYPSEILTCNKDKVLTTESFSKSDYENLAADII